MGMCGRQVKVPHEPRTSTCFFQERQVKIQLLTQEAHWESQKEKYIGIHIRQRRTHGAVRKPGGKQKLRRFSYLHANDVCLHGDCFCAGNLCTI